MKKTEWLKNYFTKAEKLLWMFSVIGIISAFFIFDRNNYYAYGIIDRSYFADI